MPIYQNKSAIITRLDPTRCYAKAYDTRSGLSQMTCWIRQNLRMSDRVSHPKAYDTRSDMSYTMGSNGVLGG